MEFFQAGRRERHKDPEDEEPEEDVEELGNSSSSHQSQQKTLPSIDAVAAEVAMVEKEHMFDKVVTPSDVGKLNRLVIPKQHAERYFPLDASANEKDRLLSFEDRTGKPWRFRYSYWNSSQSYVMTKGWSRFVKEKKLDAGDIVSFGRAVSAKDRLFIDWKRRPESSSSSSAAHHNHNYHRMMPPLQQFHHHSHPLMLPSSPVVPWNRLFMPQQSYYNYNSVAGSATVAAENVGSYLYMRSAAQKPAAVVFESIPVVHGKAAATAKRMRLFGVNVECPATAAVEDDVQLRLFSGSAVAAEEEEEVEKKGKASLTFDLDV
ncbi:hypothetical protein QJS10_CPB20g01608 [Acorus calamus]|uniref:TF-B3 domain-containing protein n=1 Tax=Acorus calamus TaxID=4465 RepID=A0AAV9CA96_ACOCL|nr:hypothetical protein QJS10_CPB20g01608 [Acorus calamus]